MKQINMVAMPNFTSYGECATQIIKSLTKLGYRINLFPISSYGFEALPEDHTLFQTCVNNAQSFDYNAPSVRLWHAFDMGLRAGRGKSFAFTIFELDRFTENERIHLNSHDGVIVTSQWAKQICLNNNIQVPIYVVPLGIDKNLFHPNYPKDFLKRKDPSSTVFINVGKKELRKHDIILKCFEEAFTPSCNVELHMVWHNRILENRNPSESAAWTKYYKQSKLSDKITLYDWLPSQQDVAKLLCCADCGIFPSHAEGWNFGLMQAMAVGLPVITTNYSAHQEYCNRNNSMLIEIDKLEPAYDNIFFNGSGSWAELGRGQEEQLINYMRNIHHRKQSGDNLFNIDGVKTAEKYSWENTAKILVDFIL